MRIVDVCALRAAVVETYGGIEGDLWVDLVDAQEFRIHPVVVFLVKVDERDVAHSVGDLVRHPRLAGLGDALERTAPRRSRAVPAIAALDRRDNDEICARSVGVGEIRLKIVCEARDAAFVVPVFNVKIVAWLQAAALTMRIGARGKSALPLVADGEVCGSPARKARADAGIVLKREKRRRNRLVRAGGVRAKPHGPPDVHVIHRLAADGSGDLRLLGDRQ